jgi:hypothetical protein
MHSRRIGALWLRNAMCSTRSSSVSSPQCRSSSTQTIGRFAASSSSSLRNAHAISSADVAASDSPRSERRGAPAASSEGSEPSCFTISTTGQYVIPSP